MAAKVRLSLKGLEEVAKSTEVKAEVEALAERVAAEVRSQGIMVEGVPGDVALPVNVWSDDASSMRVNRAKSWVTIAHNSGLAVQAKHGALTRAASAVGLEVKGD